MLDCSVIHPIEVVSPPCRKDWLFYHFYRFSVFLWDPWVLLQENTISSRIYLCQNPLGAPLLNPVVVENYKLHQAWGQCKLIGSLSSFHGQMEWCFLGVKVGLPKVSWSSAVVRFTQVKLDPVLTPFTEMLLLLSIAVGLKGMKRNILAWRTSFRSVI